MDKNIRYNKRDDRRKTKKAFKIPFTSKEGGKRFLDLLPVKKIADNHQGKIEIENLLNQGTTITIRLPLKNR